ncbi:hypothetical protein GCM10027277_53380 [Pseudoduganella ginsengisoli]
MRAPLLAAWLAGLLAVPGAASAVPLALDQQQVMAGAAVLYNGRIADLRTAQLLDNDAAFHARVQRIVQPLLLQAARDYPESAAWQWEVHTTTDPEEHAYAFAGGKVLVSSAHADALNLSDGELAMVLAHEIAHAVLRHNLLEYEEAIRLEPAWAEQPFAALEHAVDHDGPLMAKLAPLGRQQELEADRAGLQLAARAGWEPHVLAGYFRKLVQASSAPNASGFAHPSPASRWRAARAAAAQLHR